MKGTFNDNSSDYITFRLSLYNYNYTECKDIEKTQKIFKDNELLLSTLYPKLDYFIDDANNPFHYSHEEIFNFISNDNFLYEVVNFQVKKNTYINNLQ